MFEHERLEFRYVGSRSCLNMFYGTEATLHYKIKPDQVELVRHDYMANEGGETFLSYEDTRQDTVVGLLRLRKCGRNTTCPELMGKCSIVHELRVYGTAVPVHGGILTSCNTRVMVPF